jgi:ABC-2 type transport system permease protein
MIRLTRSEILKLRTTPGPFILIGVTMALTALGIITPFFHGLGGGGFGLRGAALKFQAPTSIHDLRDLLGSGYTSGAEFMAAVLGVLCVTGEYRHQVITTTLLVEPRRERVLVAKAITSVLLSIILAIATLVMVAAMGIPLLVSQGGSASHLIDQSGAVLPGLFATFALFSLFGLGFGTLLRNQIAGVLLTIALAFIVEPIFDGLVPEAGRWLPAASAAAVAGGLTGRGGRTDLLSWWLGAIVLFAWGVVPSVLGYFTTFSRDVT